MRCVVAFIITASCTFSAAAEPLKNHYNDPFIQVTQGVPNCPVPRGPFMTIAEANAEAHPRIERGTTCFMSGKCSEANAYRYDSRVVEAAKVAIESAVKKSASLTNTSVWLTVQRRFICVHGCVQSKAHVAQLESLLKSVPVVEYVGADLIIGDPKKIKRVPYPTM